MHLPLVSLLTFMIIGFCAISVVRRILTKWPGIAGVIVVFVILIPLLAVFGFALIILKIEFGPWGLAGGALGGLASSMCCPRRPRGR